MTEEVQGLLEALSSRARDLVSRARPRAGEEGRPRDAAGISERLRAHHATPFAAVIAFELLLGGRDLDIAGTTFQLGIVYGFLREGEAVPIALVAHTPALRMSLDGEILGESGALFPRSASLTSLLEQFAIVDERLCGPAAAFTIDVQESDALDLPSALSLARVEEACDRYQAWWAGGDVVFLRSVVDGRIVPELVRGYARRVEDIVRILEAARAGSPRARFDVGCTVERIEAGLQGTLARHEGAARYGDEVAMIEGEILTMQGEEPRIEQYRAIGGVLYGWDTFRDEGCVCRVADGGSAD